MIVFLLLSIVILVLMLVGLNSRKRIELTIDRTTIPALDLKRYMGTWYEIARFNHRFERGLQQVQARYELHSDGKVAVLNSGTDPMTNRRKEAHGKAHATNVPGKLRVSFFWIFYSDYNILELDEAYSWALIGSRTSDYLWILSRTPHLPDSVLDHLLHRAEERGYETDRLIFVDQDE